MYRVRPILVAARFKEWVCGLSRAGIAGSNPAGGIDVCLYESWVLAGKGLCDGLITHLDHPIEDGVSEFDF